MTECSVSGCGRAFVARGLCSLHYSRWRRTGTLELVDHRDLATYAVRLPVRIAGPYCRICGQGSGHGFGCQGDAA